MPEWHRWNSEAGRTFYHETGFLILAGKEMRPGGFEYDSHEVMRSLGQDVERMNGARIRSRFPAQPDGTEKIATHGSGFPVDPKGEKVVPAEVDQRLSDFLAESLPGLSGSPIVRRRLCLYCDSWDGDFWIDWDPDHEGLLVATGGSGHGFNFAPLIGAVISDKIEGKANPWESRFRWRTPGERRTEAARME